MKEILDLLGRQNDSLFISALYDDESGYVSGMDTGHAIEEFEFESLRELKKILKDRL